jgi:ABC-type nitrate/sulfonate/bicarbonate transport system substrate-binding protein
MYVVSIKKTVWLCAAFYLSLLTGSALGEDITVSYAALTAAYMDHIVAIEKGYILEEGLNVKIMRAGGGRQPKPCCPDNCISAHRRVLP